MDIDKSLAALARVHLLVAKNTLSELHVRGSSASRLQQEVAFSLDAALSALNRIDPPELEEDDEPQDAEQEPHWAQLIGWDELLDELHQAITNKQIATTILRMYTWAWWMTMSGVHDDDEYYLDNEIELQGISYRWDESMHEAVLMLTDEELEAMPPIRKPYTAEGKTR